MGQSDEPQANDPRNEPAKPGEPRPEDAKTDETAKSDGIPAADEKPAETPADDPPADDTSADDPTADPAADDKPADGAATAETTAGEKPEDAKTEVIGPPIQRSNTRLLVAIGLAILVLAGGGVAVVALATNTRPEDSALQQARAEARAVADRFAVLFEQARNDGAFALSRSDVQTLLCAREQDPLEQEWQERENKEIARSNPPSSAPRLRMSVLDVKLTSENEGFFTLVGAQEDRRTNQDFALVKEDSRWKVCGVTFRTPSSSRSTSPATTEPSEPTGVPGDTVPTETFPSGSGTTTTPTTGRTS